MKGQKNENTAVFMLNKGFEITYTDKNGREKNVHSLNICFPTA